MRQFILIIFTISTLAYLSSCSGEGGAASSGLKTASGHGYEIFVDKSGPVIQEGQYAYFNYTRRLDDSLMDSSYGNAQKPSMKMQAQTPGPQANPLIEIISLMSVGDSARVSLALDSIPNVPPEMKKFKFLNMDVVLNDIKSEEEYMAEQEKLKAEQAAKAEITKARLPEVEALIKSTLADYRSGKLDGKLETTASGLKYLIHEDGTGDKVKPGAPVNAHYYGSLIDGTRFDDSFSRGNEFSFPLGAGQVIRGWDEGFAIFKKGTKASLFIPSDLGYGERGSPPTIPGNSELHFYIEMQ